MAAKVKIDWDKMEADWVAGIKSEVQLSQEYGVSRPAIRKHWDKLGIGRDLTAKINAAASTMVTSAMVAGKVTDGRTVTDKEVIKTAAELQAGAILKEREEIKALSEHADRLEESLKNSTEDIRITATVTKQVVEIREKVINLRRRNFGINDNSNGDANKTPVQEVRYTVIDSTFKRIPNDP